MRIKKISIALVSALSLVVGLAVLPAANDAAAATLLDVRVPR